MTRVAVAVVAVAVVTTLMTVVTVVAAVPGAGASGTVPRGPSTTLHDGHGITVVSSRWLDPRLLDLTVSSPALPAPAGVRILVPSGYRAHPGVRYPVLYLLHGGYGSYTDWTTGGGQAEQLTAGLPLIVVMPDGGEGGWYSNWDNSGAGGPPEWETFHIDELIPWVDANFRTIATRSGRAIAGLSMGGFGALSYAARHPRLFAAAASFSGAVNLNDPGLRYLVYLSPLAEGGPAGAIYGSALFDNPLAESHNPYNLAANLRGMHIDLYSGNGFPGPLDPPGTGYDYNEFAVHEMTVALSRQLDRLGIPHSFDDYGDGTHTWPYWNRDLKEELTVLLSVLAGPGHHSRARAAVATAPVHPEAAAPPHASTLPVAGGESQPVPPAGPSLAGAVLGLAVRPLPTATRPLSPALSLTAASVLSVTSGGRDNGACSRSEPCRTVAHAVSVARPGDRISVGAGSFVGDVTVNKDLTIAGVRGRTVLSGRPRSTSAVVAVAAGAGVSLEGLTVHNPDPQGDGVASSGTVAVDRDTLSGSGGAGLDVVAGTATVADSTISDNDTYGIANAGTVQISGTTISGNDYGVVSDGSATIDASTVSSSDSGGVVTLEGSTTVDASTIVGNLGEGVQAFSGTTQVAESTVVGNRFDGIASEPTPYAADPQISVVATTVSDNSPHGIGAVTPIVVAGVVVAGSRSGNCQGTVSDAGYDLSTDRSCRFSGKGSTNSVRAGLGPLRANGGPTRTELPVQGSRVVDVIPTDASAAIFGRDVALCAGTTDQRGVTRPQPYPHGRCDVGSVERESPPGS